MSEKKNLNYERMLTIRLLEPLEHVINMSVAHPRIGATDEDVIKARHSIEEYRIRKRLMFAELLVNDKEVGVLKNLYDLQNSNSLFQRF